MSGVSKQVRVATIISAHGIRGQVKIRCFTESPQTVAGFGTLHDKRGNAYRIAQYRVEKEHSLIATLEGIADRNAAEPLKGTELFVPSNKLPPLKDDSEYYWEALIGLEVRDTDGELLGIVHAVHNFGASDIIEIAFPNGEMEMFPFVDNIFPEVKQHEGYIKFVPPEVI